MIQRPFSDVTYNTLSVTVSCFSY